MPIRDEIVRSIVGALRIALLDADAPRWFNLSIEGFWRSFLAPALLAPLFVALIWLDFGRGAAEDAAAAPDPGAFAALRLTVYALGVVAFPLLMIPMARLLQLSDRYVAYIIMWNWSSVPQSAVMMPASLLAAAEAVPEKSAAMFSMAALVTVLFYGYLVARAGLRCPPMTAAGVVLLDFVLSLLFNFGARSLAS